MGSETFHSPRLRELWDTPVETILMHKDDFICCLRMFSSRKITKWINDLIDQNIYLNSCSFVTYNFFFLCYIIYYHTFQMTFAFFL